MSDALEEHRKSLFLKAVLGNVTIYRAGKIRKELVKVMEKSPSEVVVLLTSGWPSPPLPMGPVTAVLSCFANSNHPHTKESQGRIFQRC